MIYELEMMWKEGVVAWFGVVSRNFPEYADWNTLLYNNCYVYGTKETKVSLAKCIDILLELFSSGVLCNHFPSLSSLIKWNGERERHFLYLKPRSTTQMNAFRTVRNVSGWYETGVFFCLSKLMFIFICIPVNTTVSVRFINIQFLLHGEFSVFPLQIPNIIYSNSLVSNSCVQQKKHEYCYASLQTKILRFVAAVLLHPLLMTCHNNTFCFVSKQKVPYLPICFVVLAKQSSLVFTYLCHTI
jgi:hypothetical protein